MKKSKSKELSNEQRVRGERFTTALSDNDLRPTDYARMASVELQDVNNWKTRGIPAKRAHRAGADLGKNPEWLLAIPGAPEYLPTKAGAPDELRARQARLQPAHQELVARLIGELLKVPK